MRLSFRAKLMAIVGSAAAAIVLLATASFVLANRVDRQLDLIQERFMPRLAAGPRLSGDFDHLQRSIQDAVGAHDADALAATHAQVEALDAAIASSPALSPETAPQLTSAVDEYYQAALDVSERMLAGEVAADMADRIREMQAKRTRVVGLIEADTKFDPGALAAAFSSVSRAEAAASRFGLIVGVFALTVTLALSFWIARGVVESLVGLSEGIARFGTGDFSREIGVTSDDELGKVARRANEMARSLDRLARDRDRRDWVRGGLTGLSTELRDALAPDEVANRATAFLAQYLGLPAAAFYEADARGRLSLAAARGADGEIRARREFAHGEGLVGEAAARTEITLIGDLPPGYFRLVSGLGESEPRGLALVPLVHAGAVKGVLELAFLGEWKQEASELLALVRETLAIALEVARARVETNALLAETQKQAETLARQEEELRATNEELGSQQEELRQTNEELTRQAEELEAQRRILEETNSDLESARRNLERKADELATVSRYKSQFLANMSHELRTPLNSMLLLSDLMARNEEGNLDARQVEYSRTIHSAGKDLLALINQVLDLARVEAGKTRVRLDDVSLSSLVERARRVFGPLASDKQIEFEATLAEGLPETAKLDHQLVDQILNNLLSNAIKFTEHGRVSLRIAPGKNGPWGPTVALVVSDTGVGIAPEDQSRVFSPFEQVDGAADRRFGGTGLGLSIAREFSELLGGDLSLESEAGKGSTFVCTLPVAGRGDDPGRSAESRPDPGAARPHDGGRAAESVAGAAPGSMVLVAGGAAHGVDSAVEGLRASGIDATWVASGAEALAALRARDFGCLVLDLDLEGMSGSEFLEVMHEELGPDAPSVVVYTSRALSRAEANRLEAHAQALVVKEGASSERLLSEVRLFLRKLHASQAPARSATAAEIPGRRLEKRRILVVDDDMRTVYALSAALRGKGAEVRMADTGQEALAMLERHPDLELVLMDVMMPEMDGYEAITRIRANPRLASLPIIALTAKAMKGDAERCLAAGANRYLPKPVDMDRLLGVIHALLPEEAPGG